MIYASWSLIGYCFKKRLKVRLPQGGMFCQQCDSSNLLFLFSIYSFQEPILLLTRKRLVASCKHHFMYNFRYAQRKFAKGSDKFFL